LDTSFLTLEKSKFKKRIQTVLDFILFYLNTQALCPQLQNVTQIPGKQEEK